MSKDVAPCPNCGRSAAEALERQARKRPKGELRSVPQNEDVPFEPEPQDACICGYVFTRAAAPAAGREKARS